MRIINILNRILVIVMFIGNIILPATVHAEIEKYEGTGLAAVDVDETLEHAKEQAKLNAMRHIAEEFCTEFQSKTEIENAKIKNDEIIMMTEGLMKVIEVKYDLSTSDDYGIVIRAIVIAEIDTDEVEKLLKDDK